MILSIAFYYVLICIFSRCCTVYIFLSRRRCFSGGGSGPVGPLVPGAVEEESGVRRDTVSYRGSVLTKNYAVACIIYLLKPSGPQEI